MLYCGLRKEVIWDGWHTPIPGLERIGEPSTKARLRELMDTGVGESGGDVRRNCRRRQRATAGGYRQVQMVRLSRYLPVGERGRDRASRNIVILTADQRRAVERSGQNVCVVAGPGSGKTRVLIERFAWLVEHEGVDAGRILAITFTEKAATEIKQRLMDRFVDRADLREQIERAWVSTIHGFCARLLREHAIAAGLAPDFSVLDQAPSDRLARAAAEESIDELLRERSNDTRRLLESLDLSTQDDGRQPDLARGLLEIYEAMRLAGLRELPCVRAGARRIRESARARTRHPTDPERGKTVNQKSGHAELRQWARAFTGITGWSERSAFRARAVERQPVAPGQGQLFAACSGGIEDRTTGARGSGLAGHHARADARDAAGGDCASGSALSGKEARAGFARFLGS